MIVCAGLRDEIAAVEIGERNRVRLGVRSDVGVVRLAVVAAAPFGDGGVAVLLRIEHQRVEILRPVGNAKRRGFAAGTAGAGVEVKIPNDV